MCLSLNSVASEMLRRHSSAEANVSYGMCEGETCMGHTGGLHEMLRHTGHVIRAEHGFLNVRLALWSTVTT